MPDPDAVPDEVSDAATALAIGFSTLAQRIHELVEASYIRGIREGIEVAARACEEAEVEIRAHATTDVHDAQIAAVEWMRDHIRLSGLSVTLPSENTPAT